KTKRIIEKAEKLEPNLIRYPDKYGTSTDNFINKLALYDPNDIEVKHSDKTLITGMFVIDEIEGLPSHITNENLMFLEGAFNLYRNRIEVFTPEVLYRYSIGRKDARVTPQQAERAMQNVDRMRTILVDLDFTSFIEKYGNSEAKEFIKNDGTVITDSYMLPVHRSRKEVQGVIQDVTYSFLTCPPLLKYNDLLAN